MATKRTRIARARRRRDRTAARWARVLARSVDRAAAVAALALILQHYLPRD